MTQHNTTGEFREGRLHGQGTCIWEDGKRYSGEWQNGMMDGQGVIVYPNRERYEGGFRQGKKHGKGDFYSSNGTLLREEEWKDGKLCQKDKDKGEAKSVSKTYLRRIKKPIMF